MFLNSTVLIIQKNQKIAEIQLFFFATL